MKNKLKKKATEFNIGDLVKIKLYSLMDEIGEYSSYIPGHGDYYYTYPINSNSSYTYVDNNTWYPIHNLSATTFDITTGTTTDKNIFRQNTGEDNYKHSKMCDVGDLDERLNDILGEKDDPIAVEEIDFIEPSLKTQTKNKTEIDDLSQNNTGTNWKIDKAITAGEVTYKPAAKQVFDEKDFVEMKTDLQKLQSLTIKHPPKKSNPVVTAISNLDNETNLIGYKTLEDALNGKVERVSIKDKNSKSTNLKHTSGIIVDRFAPVIKSENGEEARIKTGGSSISFKSEGMLYKVLFGQDGYAWVREKDLSLFEDKDQFEE